MLKARRGSLAAKSFVASLSQNTRGLLGPLLLKLTFLLRRSQVYDGRALARLGTVKSRCSDLAACKWYRPAHVPLSDIWSRHAILVGCLSEHYSKKVLRIR
jgi:hypothetical protein